MRSTAFRCVPLAGLIALGAACHASPRTNASCGVADTSCVTVDFQHPAHAIAPELFGDGMEWRQFGQDVLQPDLTAQTAGTLRDDVVDALAAIQLTVLRYPGGTLADLFHWQQAVGPMGARSAQRTLDLVSPGVLEQQAPYFGPDEFQQLVDRLGVAPLLTVNVMTGTPEEAAGWVQHRRDQGLAGGDWEVGNEPYLPLIDPSVAPSLTPEDYASRFNAYGQAMRAIDPSIRLTATGWRNYDGACLAQCADDWNARVLPRLTEVADRIALHDGYAPGGTAGADADFAAMLAAPEAMRENLARQIADVDAYAPEASRGAGIAITEHGALFIPTSTDPTTFVQELQRNENLASALYSALVLHVMLANPRVVMANHINPVSATFQAPIQLALPDTSNVPVSYPEDYSAQPTLSAYGAMLALYRPLAGGRFVAATVSGSPTYDSVASGLVAARSQVPMLDAIAALDASGAMGWLFVVNRSLDTDVTARIALGGTRVGEGRVVQLTGASYQALNVPGAIPQVVASSAVAINGPVDPSATFDQVLPACSVTRFDFALP